MKNRNIRIWNIVLVISLAACISLVNKGPDFYAESTTAAALTDTGNENTSMVNILPGYVLYLENNRLALYINADECNFLVRDKIRGSNWYGSPPDASADTLAKGVNSVNLQSLLFLDIYEAATDSVITVNSRTESVGESGYKLRKMKKGVEFYFNFPLYQITVPLQIQLEEDFISAKVNVSQIEEAGPNKVFGVSVLPNFGAGKIGEKGFLFVPDGSGAVINFNNGKTKTNDYSEYVYGSDASDEAKTVIVNKETIRLPVFGISREKGAMLAIIRSADSQSMINAYVSGRKNSYNAVYSKFEIRKQGKYNIDEGYRGSKEFDIYQEGRPALAGAEINYFFSAGEGGISDLASTYRDYLIKYQGMKEKPLSPELYLGFLGAVQKKEPVMGIPMNKTYAITPIEKVLEISRNLQQNGAIPINVNYKNWTDNAISRKINSTVHVNGKIGGNSKWGELAAFFKDNGQDLFPEADLVNFTSQNYPFQKYFDAARNLNGAIASQNVYKLSTYVKDTTKSVSYLLSPLKAVSNAARFFDNYNKTGQANIALGTLGNAHYSDFSKTISERYATQEAMRGILQTSAGFYKKTMLTAPNAYAFPYVSDILESPVYSSKMDLFDYDVPFYQLSLSGLVNMTVPAVNLYYNPRDMLLKALETGSDLYYSLGTDNLDKLKDTPFDYMIGIGYEDWKDTILKDYSEYKNVRNLVDNNRLTGFEYIQKNVTKASYSQAYSIVLNYNKTGIDYEGMTIPSRGYMIFKGGEAIG